MQRCAVTVAAVILVVLAGCSGNSADPVPSTSSSSSAAVVEVSSSSSSGSPVAVSSGARPTPSVADPPTPTTPDPWPADLTPEQLVGAQAALEAYRGYWQMVDVAVNQPSQDWSQQVGLYATGPAKASLLETLSQLTTRGRYAVGTTTVAPQVGSVEPGLVTINDCVDKTATDLLDLQGNSVKAPDVAGSYFRHPATAQMAELADGRWVMAFKSDDWSQTC